MVRSTRRTLLCYSPSLLLHCGNHSDALAICLDKDERRLNRLARIKIEGGLLPSVSLLRDLVQFLNKARTAPGKRIVKILEKMLELEEMTKPIKPEEPMITAIEWKRTAKKYEMHWDIEVRTAMLERELSKYQFTPHAEVVMGGGGRSPSQWAVWWRGNSKSGLEKGLRMQASEALELILKLTQAGDLNRLRRCPQCQKWLFARFGHQAFCSTKCQQKNYTQSEAWKAHRRAYMRRYYKENFGRK